MTRFEASDSLGRTDTTLYV